VCPRVAIIYNATEPSRYDSLGEREAVVGVLDAVRAVDNALKELDYEVEQVPLAFLPQSPNQGQRLVEADLVFNLFEGFCGRPDTEAEVAEFLTASGMPYTGCPAPTLRLALDKATVKAVLKANGIDTPAFQLLTPETTSTFRLRYPCIVKPCGEDASHGISRESVADSPAALEKQVARISQSYGGKALVEEFIDGREFNVTVLGDSEASVLPVSEIDYTLADGVPRILTYAAKWDPASPDFKGTQVVCPASITEQERERLEEVALRAFRLLGCRGYARIDLRVDSDGRVNVLEVNPNPDISPGSGAARQAAAAGMTYTQFINRITLRALERSGR